MSDDSLALLSRVLDQTRSIIAAVGPDQASAPTPCTQWNMRQLVNHVVHDVQQFTAVAQGEGFKASDADVVGDDWLAAYDAAAGALRAAWNEPGALDRTAKLPFGEVPATWQVGQQITDLAVHAWDVARAAGQHAELDPAVIEAALAWGRQNLKPEFRGAAFGPEVPVAADAPSYSQLIGFFGRDPAWRAHQGQA